MSTEQRAKEKKKTKIYFNFFQGLPSNHASYGVYDWSMHNGIFHMAITWREFFPKLFHWMQLNLVAPIWYAHHMFLVSFGVINLFESKSFVGMSTFFFSIDLVYTDSDAVYNLIMLQIH